jgi:hypothetical protein
MKIIIAVIVPILLGIVVGSNLLPTMAIVIFNQPTIALPIGVLRSDWDYYLVLRSEYY